MHGRPLPAIAHPAGSRTGRKQPPSQLCMNFGCAQEWTVEAGMRPVSEEARVNILQLLQDFQASSETGTYSSSII
eukprot:scaffold166234_cov33-Prasinocladus_malaysianus.AAC.1